MNWFLTVKYLCNSQDGLLLNGDLQTGGFLILYAFFKKQDVRISYNPLWILFTKKFEFFQEVSFSNWFVLREFSFPSRFNIPDSYQVNIICNELF